MICIDDWLWALLEYLGYLFLGIICGVSLALYFRNSKH